MSSNDNEFAKSSVLDILIPESSNLDIEEALGSTESAREADDLALITTIPQRSLLFFGMSQYLHAQNYILLICREL